LPGQSVGPIFKGQEIKEKVDFLSFEFGADWLSRNVARNSHYTLRNIAEEGRYRLLGGGSLSHT
jgi:hypothetical protein